MLSGKVGLRLLPDPYPVDDQEQATSLAREIEKKATRFAKDTDASLELDRGQLLVKLTHFKFGMWKFKLQVD